jgi:hypothetical protein
MKHFYLPNPFHMTSQKLGCIFTNSKILLKITSCCRVQVENLIIYGDSQQNIMKMNRNENWLVQILTPELCYM